MSEIKDYKDALDLKRQIQKQMWEEFQANKDKFKTYDDYLDYLDAQPSEDPEFDAFLESVRYNAKDDVEDEE